jgi:hypothetical protein
LRTRTVQAEGQPAGRDIWDSWDIRLRQNQVKAICLTGIMVCCIVVGVDLMTKADPDARFQGR